MNNTSIANLTNGVDEKFRFANGSSCNPLYFKQSLDVAELDVSSVTIYPNPFNTMITIESSTVQAGTIIVRDIVGKMISTMPITGNITTVQLNGLTVGLYTVEVLDSKSNRLSTTKLIKQ